MDTLLNLFPELQLAGLEVQLCVLRCINQTKLAELERRNAAELERCESSDSRGAS